MTIKKNRTLKVSLMIMVVLILIVISSAITYIYHVVTQYDLIFAQHIYVNNIPIGGLTQEEAYTKVSDELNDYNENHFITLIDGSREVTLSLSAFRPTNNVKEVLSKAFVIGHEGNIFKRYFASKNKKQNPLYYDVLNHYELLEIEKVLDLQAEVFNIAPINAVMERKDRKFFITPEVNGYALDSKATAKLVYERLQEKKLSSGPIQVVMNEVVAPITEAHLQKAQTPLASFSTAYNNQDQDRNENLALAASKINIQLAPDEIFSLSSRLEPITASAGYKASKVIVNGKLEEGIGGGVCQIASTLYNALLLSDVEIYSRANHSLPVAYVPLGRDATYASGLIDFKFRNNSSYPLFVESYCADNKIIVNLFGHESLKLDYDEIKFSSELIKTVAPPPVTYVKDDTLYVDQKIQEVSPLEGKTVKLYRLMYKNNELVQKQLINTSYYKVRGEVIRVGTKERPKTP